MRFPGKDITVCLAAALLAGAVFLTGCAADIAADKVEQKLTVAVTIYPLADIVGNLGGEAVSVICLLPPGASPHTYEPSVEQVIDAAGASLFVCIGGGLDDWVLKLAGAAQSTPEILELMEAIILPESGEDMTAGHGGASPGRDEPGHSGGPVDPHIWLDPLLVRDRLCPVLAGTLAALDPTHEQLYRANLADYQAALTALNREVKTSLAGLAQRGYISMHGAWQYFARRYGLQEAAAITDFPGQEPSATWMAQLVDLCRAHGVRVVFAEPQLSPLVAEAIAGEIEGKVALLDPLGGAGLPQRETYLDLMRYNTNVFKEALAD